MEQHIGIDLGATHCHIAVAEPNATVVAQRQVRTQDIVQWLHSQPPSRIVMEACTQSREVAEAARQAQHQVIVVPSTVVRALGVGARGIKTDSRDAVALAKACARNVELPTVHVRSPWSASVHQMLQTRASLQKARTALGLRVKSWLRGRLIRLRGRAHTKAFCEAVRHTALQHPDGLPRAIDMMLETFEHLSEQLSELDRELQRIATANPVCRMLQQLPGVGPIVALAFVAHIDDPHRFANRAQLGSYLALSAGEKSTGGRVVRTGTIKSGPRYLKSLLVQAAWVMWRTRPNEPMVRWARAIAQKRAPQVAIMALARKLATVMWSMWKHDRAYDPTRAVCVAQLQPSEPEDSAPTAAAG